MQLRSTTLLACLALCTVSSPGLVLAEPKAYLLDEPRLDQNSPFTKPVEAGDKAQASAGPTTSGAKPQRVALADPDVTGSIHASEPTTGVRALIARHAAVNGVPFHLADAMVKIESRYNPRARNGVNLGLGQINLRTARGLGYAGGGAGLMDANTNLTYSVKYLAQAYRMARGDTCGTVMRYQNGLGATRMNGANRAYCAKVKAHRG